MSCHLDRFIIYISYFTILYHAEKCLLNSERCWTSSVLSAQMNGERRGILVDEAAEAARHLLAPEVGLQMRLHVVPASHLLVAQQTHELRLSVRTKHRLCAGFKGRNPWK